MQLVAPSKLKAAEVSNWLARQPKEVATDAEVLQEAWTEMQDMGYSRNETKEEWLAALPREMEVKLDTASNKMAVRMLGDSPADACIAANAVAAAYSDKAAQLKGDRQPGQTRTASLAVRATPAAVAKSIIA